MKAVYEGQEKRNQAVFISTECFYHAAIWTPHENIPEHSKQTNLTIGLVWMTYVLGLDLQSCYVCNYSHSR